MTKKRTEFSLKHRFSFILENLNLRKTIFKKEKEKEKLKYIELLKKRFIQNSMIAKSLEEALISKLIEGIYMLETDLITEEKELTLQTKEKEIPKSFYKLGRISKSKSVLNRSKVNF
jgi:hypothetical protein